MFRFWNEEDQRWQGIRYKPEEIVNILRQAEVLHGQGMSMADALRQLGISEVNG